MKKKYEKVYQYKITLKEIKLPIWRLIQVPETYTFWDLHIAVQDSMGWTDTHLHHFEIVNPSTAMREEIGIPDEDFIDTAILAGWKREMANYFSKDNDTAEYVYDYGDNWKHTIILEKILSREKGVKYPVCVGGARACPPEDCGEKWGYEKFLDAIMYPDHEKHEELLDWVGGDFASEHFEAEDVEFDNPKKRLEHMLFE